MIPWKRTQKLVTEYKIEMFHDKNDSLLCVKYRSGYSVQLLSHLTFCNPMNCSTLGFPVLHHLPELAQIHVHQVGDAIQPSHLLSSPSPPALNLCQHQGLSQWVSSLYPKNWLGQSIGVSASTSALPMNIQDWFPLGWTGWISLIHETLRSLLQQHSPKASILWCLAFFITQVSHSYMTTGTTIALARWTFLEKVICPKLQSW